MLKAETSSLTDAGYSLLRFREVWDLFYCKMSTFRKWTKWK